MSRVAKSILIAIFFITLVEMCREFAFRTYVIFGLFPGMPDITLYGGIAILILDLAILKLISRNLKQSNG